MNKRAVPMIHVPDVEATVNWYKNIGFTVNNTYGNDGDGFSFAILSFGTSEVMFNQGGQTSESKRREVDLYVYTDNVDELYQRLKEQVDVVEGPHDTFYGMREFILRDLNRFWITFAQHSIFSTLLEAVYEGNIEAVRSVLDSGGVKTDTLSAALASLAKDQKHAKEIKEMLEALGAISAFEVEAETLKSYVGKYKKDDLEIKITLEDGELYAAPGRQDPLLLRALNRETFTPVYLQDFGNITFNVEDGKTTGCTVGQGPHAMKLNRLSDQ